MISAATRLAVLLGDPVAHSRSPAMLNAAFDARKIDAVYLAWRVGEAALSEAVATLAAVGALGANVTVPHKERAVSCVDALSDRARVMQCVNCVTFDPRGSTGHNTDAPGLERALREQLGKRVRGPAVILGAGGAARAAAVALQAFGVGEMAVVNRSSQRRRAFNVFATRAGVAVATHPWSDVVRLCADAAIVVNATSAQVKNEALTLPFDRMRAVIYDLTYGRTPLVARAETAGLRAFDGSLMLLHQAAVAFELWTGKTAPLAAMRKALGLGAT
ncbi:MAG: shikimate dehydrogenase [Deltaproteobacteria bacterium]|nr:shikimate dehydrogenase [Deltaproteobacteria bacterium]